jgi:hypothetical protein
MTYYLIDFENVHVAGIQHPELCTEGDQVCIFYGPVSQDLPLTAIHALFQKKVLLQTIPVNTGTKNALDFQLTTQLGYLIGQGEHSGAAYRIVSGDTGYDCVVAYWTSRNVDIARIPNLEGKAAKAPEAAKTSGKTGTSRKHSKGIISTTKAEVLQYLTPEEYEDDILNIINGYKTKQSISNYFAKHFRDSQKSSAIYKKLKPLLAEKGKT